MNELNLDGMALAPGVVETIVSIAANEVEGVASVGSAAAGGLLLMRFPLCATPSGSARLSVRRTRSRHRMGTILGAWGESLKKHFGRCNPAKIAKHVYVCIACRFYPEFGIIQVSNAALSTAMPISWISRTGALML